uniref:inositol-phosphate phosphatase n=1 Tax=Cyprinus carpio carpio TaxID=630221 RepID=A0A9J8AT03_CYPCA
MVFGPALQSLHNSSAELTLVCEAVRCKMLAQTYRTFLFFGSNVVPRASYNTNFPKVIVSRSHSGKVKSFVQVAFGNNTEIIPAGGAGYKVLALLDPTDEEQDTARYLHPCRREQIDYSGTEGNKGGLLASIKTDHEALVKRLPPWEENKQ